MNRRVTAGVIVAATIVFGVFLLFASHVLPESGTASSTSLIPASGTLTILNNTIVFYANSSGEFVYAPFPYSNFSLDNFTFAYLRGSCQNASTGIQILPCGSTLYATFPSSGRHSIPTEASAGSLHRQGSFQWTSIGYGVVDGRLETVGLVLVMPDTGPRVVYVYVGVGH